VWLISKDVGKIWGYIKKRSIILARIIDFIEVYEQICEKLVKLLRGT
jgi:hypothetical protein